MIKHPLERTEVSLHSALLNAACWDENPEHSDDGQAST